MSRRIKGVAVIEVEPDMICHECGKVAEVRPYGPGFSEICFDCGAKDPVLTMTNMNIRLYGETSEDARKHAEGYYDARNHSR